MTVHPGTDERPSPQHSILTLAVVRRLLVSYGASALGSAVVGVAIAYTAYSKSSSVVLTVLVLGSAAFPTILLLPVIGKLTVRLDARTVEEVCLAGKVALSMLLALVAAAGGLQFWVLLCGSLANGVLSAFAGPAWPQLVRRCASDERLAEVTAALNGVGAVAAIVGAVAGGVIVSAAGAEWCFALNGLSYVPLLLLVPRLPSVGRVARREGRAVRAGIDAVRAANVLRRAFLLAALLNLAAWPVLSLLPAVASDIDGQAHVLGYLLGAFYAGVATVSYLTRRLGRHHPYSRVLFVGFVGVGVLLVAQASLIAWRTPGLDAVSVAVLTLLPIGLALALDSTLVQTLVQLGSPDETQGPVLVLYAALSTVITPLGGIALGAVADEISLWGSLALSGVMLVVCGVAMRPRFSVFDEVQELLPEQAPARRTHAWHLTHLVHLFAWDQEHRFHDFHRHLHTGSAVGPRPDRPAQPVEASSPAAGSHRLQPGTSLLLGDVRRARGGAAMAHIEDVQSWIGAEAVDSNDESLGKVEEILLDGEGEAALASIKSGLITKHRLVPLEGAAFSRGHVRVAYPKDLVARRPSRRRTG